MAVRPLLSKAYKNEAESSDRYRESIHSVVKRMTSSHNTENCFDHVSATPIQSQASVARIIQQVRRIIFPGYFSLIRFDPVNLEYHLKQETIELFESLSKEIVISIQHDCLRDDQPCSQCTEYGRETALQFILALPEIKDILATDTRSAFEGDPAAKNYDEIIFSYPGLFAITVYRMAHIMHMQNVPLLPRMMTEYAHSLTGIDIHPGAKIGKSFFIDHGTGVVVGETTEIGDRVTLYQGVTLGALSIPKHTINHYRDKKRHPTIEDDVIIYSNTTILGGKTVIGARSIIGGNVWITASVPPDTKVILKPPELIYIGNNSR